MGQQGLQSLRGAELSQKRCVRYCAIGSGQPRVCRVFCSVTIPSTSSFSECRKNIAVSCKRTCANVGQCFFKSDHSSATKLKGHQGARSSYSYSSSRVQHTSPNIARIQSQVHSLRPCMANDTYMVVVCQKGSCRPLRRLSGFRAFLSETTRC